MAGNYFHDPRPFYGLSHHNLISMDELFYGRREPPPWYMHQMPQVHYGDQPQRSRSVDPQRPEHYIQREDQYRRPDMRHDIYMDPQYNNMQGHHQGQQQQQQKNHNQGGNNNNHGGNNHHGGNNNNHGGNNHHGGISNKGKNQQQKHQNDSDDEDYGNNHNHGNKGKGNNKSHNNDHSHGHNKSHSNDYSHGHTKSWSDNKGFHGGRGGHGHHRRSLSLTQTILKKFGLRDDSSSSDSSDDERYSKNKKGGHGQKAHNVRFDDQFYGNSNSNKKGGSGSDRHGLGEDHGSHGKNKNGGGQPQGILKTSKNNNKHGDYGGYSSDEENRGHKNQKGGNQQHGGSESGKKNGQTASKQLGRSQSMDFRVNLCCENCERKVHKALRKLDVDQVLTDQWNNKVVVTGNAKPESVLKKLRSVKKFKDTHLWQYK